MSEDCDETGLPLEIIQLEQEIADALPAASEAADQDISILPLVAFAHDILCNGWTVTPGTTRLERLRTIAHEIRRFAPVNAE